MCGISCLINFGNKLDLKKNINYMIEALNHRGPDFSDYYLNNNLAIGHNRLSIIDLSNNANQPFYSKNKKFILSYNGEIYNYIEIKKTLENNGFIFNTNSDTEVVLNSLIYWGIDAVKKFNGMFAFIFYDVDKNEIIFCRDRYGIKPIYYYRDSDFFALASEQKAIMKIDQFKHNLDYEALYEYFTFQNIFTDKTLEKKIKMFPPASIGKYNINSNILNIDSYWDYNYNSTINNELSYDDSVIELEHLFKQAVKRQLISDVEISSYLSSGVDTGSISAVASQYINNLKTFTCGFDNTSATGIEIFFDETKQAKNISEYIGSNHHELIINSKDMENSLDKLVYHLEEPRVGQSYPNYLISNHVSKYSKVVLSGTGGDELFAGYPWRYMDNINTSSNEDFLSNYYLKWQRLVNNSTLKKLFSPIQQNTKNVWTKNIFSNIFDKKNKDTLNFSKESIVNDCLYFESKTFLQGLLIVEDKLSMANSLEVRVPFLDNDLVDFAMKCPVKYKINLKKLINDFDENTPGNKKDIYFSRTNNGKIILRDVLSKFVTKEVAFAKKQGFSGPDSSWFKNDSYDFLNDKIMSPNSLIFNYMDRAIVKNLFLEHLNGKSNNRLFLWSLLYFETYLNIFKN